MYYSKKDYKLMGYEKATKVNKMYNAILENKKTKKIYYVPFGDKRYMNYRDLTGLNLYPHLIHNDNKRRMRYRARAKGKVKDGYYSPSWFSYHILW